MSEPAAHEFGYVERWLRACGQRPWRTFTRSLALLIIFWLGLGFVGFRWNPVPDLAPPVAAVPYRDFIDGGQRAESFALELDPTTLPTFDPTSASPNVGYSIWFREDEPRLVAHVPVSDGIWGWPWTLVRLSTSAPYDVSDPREPYVKYDMGSIPPQVTDVDSQRVVATRFDQMVRRWNVLTLDWNRVTWMIAVIEGLAAGFVIACWAFFAIRRRRRVQAGRCLTCGHDLRPFDLTTTCQECGAVSLGGSDVAGPAMISSWNRGRVFLLTTAGLMLVWFTLSLLMMNRQPRLSIEEHLAEIAKESEERSVRTDIIWPPVYRGGRMVDTVSFGWPVPVIRTWKGLSYEWRRGEGAKAVPRRFPVGHSTIDGYVQLQFALDDPAQARIVNVYWAGILLVVLGAQLIAALGVLGAGTVVAVLRHVRR